MDVPGWLAALVLGALAFIVGLVVQLSGAPHIGLAISMVGAMVAVAGGMCRPRGSH
jgi:type IV secretory pathway TrbD component